MKKKKKVKSYTRHSKSGRIIVVRNYNADYNARDNQNTPSEHDGEEFEAKKKKREINQNVPFTINDYENKYDEELTDKDEPSFEMPNIEGTTQQLQDNARKLLKAWDEHPERRDKELDARLSIYAYRVSSNYYDENPDSKSSDEKAISDLSKEISPAKNKASEALKNWEDNPTNEFRRKLAFDAMREYHEKINDTEGAKKYKYEPKVSEETNTSSKGTPSNMSIKERRKRLEQVIKKQAKESDKEANNKIAQDTLKAEAQNGDIYAQRAQAFWDDGKKLLSYYGRMPQNKPSTLAVIARLILLGML